ncbi:MAG: hypothetical protein KC592_08670 [Nitrospira sp.]|nr:hypothetical protein [Nitrospira sp.]
MLTCNILVLLMQAGFTCLETGTVRAKNPINLTIKAKRILTRVPPLFS